MLCLCVRIRRKSQHELRFRGRRDQGPNFVLFFVFILLFLLAFARAAMQRCWIVLLLVPSPYSCLFLSLSLSQFLLACKHDSEHVLDLLALPGLDINWKDPRLVQRMPLPPLLLPWLSVDGPVCRLDRGRRKPARADRAAGRARGGREQHQQGRLDTSHDRCQQGPQACGGGFASIRS